MLRLLLRLSPELELVDEATNGEEALESVKRFQPDVLVMDVRMPLLDGWKATRQIVELGLGTRVILISLDRGGFMVMKARQSGAQGFVPKDEIPSLLRNAIQSVYEGNTVYVE